MGSDGLLGHATPEHLVAQLVLSRFDGVLAGGKLSLFGAGALPPDVAGGSWLFQPRGLVALLGQRNRFATPVIPSSTLSPAASRMLDPQRSNARRIRTLLGRRSSDWRSTIRGSRRREAGEGPDRCRRAGAMACATWEWLAADPIAYVVDDKRLGGVPCRA